MSLHEDETPARKHADALRAKSKDLTHSQVLALAEALNNYEPIMHQISLRASEHHGNPTFSEADHPIFREIADRFSLDIFGSRLSEQANRTYFDVLKKCPPNRAQLEERLELAKYALIRGLPREGSAALGTPPLAQRIQGHEFDKPAQLQRKVEWVANAFADKLSAALIQEASPKR